MSETELKPDSVLLGERNYAAAIDWVIAAAQHKLLIFDQDLSHGDYASASRYDLLYDFLSKNPLSKLTIVLQFAEHFSHNCPRLLGLLETYGHKMTIYETNDSAKIAKDCFVIADDKHYVRRFHIDQARFKYNMDDEVEAANLDTRFNELLEETSDTVSVTKLGL
jgi:hypothetical protein